MTRDEALETIARAICETPPFCVHRTLTNNGASGGCCKARGGHLVCRASEYDLRIAGHWLAAERALKALQEQGLDLVDLDRLSITPAHRRQIRREAPNA